jgi:hypothetical protein
VPDRRVKQDRPCPYLEPKKQKSCPSTLADLLSFINERRIRVVFTERIPDFVPAPAGSLAMAIPLQIMGRLDPRLGPIFPRFGRHLTHVRLHILNGRLTRFYNSLRHTRPSPNFVN